MQNARPVLGASAAENSKASKPKKHTATPRTPQEFWPRLYGLPLRPKSRAEAQARVRAARADLRDAERIAFRVVNRARLSAIGTMIQPGSPGPDRHECELAARIVRDAKARLARAEIQLRHMKRERRR